MEFRQLEAFIAVTESKSFTTAAETLFLSQSTISSHIKNLENELKKTLIVRSTKSVKLTSDGEKFLFYARRIMETRDSALTAMNAEPDSYLKLGASTIPSSYLLPAMLPKFREHHPNVYFDIFQGDSEEIYEKLADGSIELGLTGNDTENAEIVTIPFFRDELVVAAPATSFYLDLQKRRAPLEEILRSPIIMREVGSGTKKSSEKLLDALGIPEDQLNIVARNNDLEAIKRLVKGGLGISIFSSLSVQDIASQGQILTFPVNAATAGIPPLADSSPENSLRHKKNTQNDLSRTFYLAYLKSHTPKKILAEFISFAKKKFGN